MWVSGELLSHVLWVENTAQRLATTIPKKKTNKGHKNIPFIPIF
jgi:hypothetical protein